MAPLHREGADGKKESLLPDSKSGIPTEKGMPRPGNAGGSEKASTMPSPKKANLPSKPSSSASTSTNSGGGLPTRKPDASFDAPKIPTPPVKKSPEKPSALPPRDTTPPQKLASVPAQEKPVTTPPQPAPVQQTSPQQAPYSPPVQQPSPMPQGNDASRYANAPQASFQQSYQPTPATRPREIKKGNRGSVLTIRYVVLGLIGALVLFGVKGIILPPSAPSTAELSQSVQQELGISAFPADQAEGFVIAYANEFLTVGDSNSTRKEDLGQYGPADTISGGVNYPNGYQQKIIEGPYIYDINYSSADTAVYTVGANTDSSGWVYLAINVYYDSTTRGLTVASAPTFASPPVTTTLPPEVVATGVNDEASESARNAVTSFFEAWGDSDEEALSVVLTPTADARAHNGLSGAARFVDMKAFEVYNPAEGTEETGLRGAKATVTWQGPNEVVYTSTYQLLIYVDGGGKWYVHDILPAQYKPQVDETDES